MGQLMVVVALLIIGVIIFFTPIIQKGVAQNQKKNSSIEFESLGYLYENELENNEDENIFEDLKNGILEHNRAVCNMEFIGENAPVNNEVIFDTTPYGVDTDIFGYVSFEYTDTEGTIHKKEVVKKEEFPIYLRSSKTNLSVGAVPYENSALPMGSEGLTVLYGRNKTAFTDNPKSKVKIGDTVEIKTLFGSHEYKVIQYRCASREAVCGTHFDMSLPNVIFVIGEENFCTYYFCELVKKD